MVQLRVYMCLPSYMAHGCLFHTHAHTHIYIYIICIYICIYIYMHIYIYSCLYSLYKRRNACVLLFWSFLTSSQSWLQSGEFCSNSFQGESKSPVLSGVNSSKHDNHMKLCGSVSTISLRVFSHWHDSELGHATVCYKCIRTHTLFNVRWNLNIYIYIRGMQSMGSHQKKMNNGILIHSAALSTPPAEDDVSDRPQVTSRRQQVPTDHSQDFGVETCWSQASAMSRCGHVFTFLIFLFFWLWSFCMYVHVEAASLSLSLSLSCSLSLPLPTYIYISIYCM